ncbi:hypothetical protein T4B_11322 [Trichinella pseudospiralis]|uniref:Uncharacterized protein n=1 Tax=Trichinella pseudospiralis TaxID=6337 RepID=A0A0V1ISW2_TRIPS|nr:hypothetical protein T4B_11322 [Trichinella pseudospiralis]KRZ37885.1 hypothetical protein T4C_12565 [Trichinella pseudospiralis]
MEDAFNSALISAFLFDAIEISRFQEDLANSAIFCEEVPDMVPTPIMSARKKKDRLGQAQKKPIELDVLRLLRDWPQSLITGCCSNSSGGGRLSSSVFSQSFSQVLPCTLNLSFDKTLSSTKLFVTYN